MELDYEWVLFCDFATLVLYYCVATYGVISLKYGKQVKIPAPPLWRNWKECLTIQSAVVRLVVGSIPGRDLSERNTFRVAQKTQ